MFSQFETLNPQPANLDLDRESWCVQVHLGWMDRVFVRGLFKIETWCSSNKDTPSDRFERFAGFSLEPELWSPAHTLDILIENKAV